MWPNTRSWIFTVLAHWSKSSRVEMSTHIQINWFNFCDCLSYYTLYYYLHHHILFHSLYYCDWLQCRLLPFHFCLLCMWPNTQSWIFTVLAHWSKSSRVEMSFWHNNMIPSQPVFVLWLTLSLAVASRVNPFCNLQSRARTHTV
jgi:hypothetical protein